MTNRITDKFTITYYMCDEEFNISTTRDVLEWAEWFENAERHVGKDTVYGVDISTVFLSIPHCDPTMVDKEVVYLFETMLFGPEDKIKLILSYSREDSSSIFAKFFGMTDFQRRYKTLEEARAGHTETVSLVTRALTYQN